MKRLDRFMSFCRPVGSWQYGHGLKMKVGLRSTVTYSFAATVMAKLAIHTDLDSPWNQFNLIDSLVDISPE
jgi:hypothetical protein